MLFGVYSFLVTNGALFAQKLGLRVMVSIGVRVNCRSGVSDTILRTSVISYVTYADSGR